MSRRVTLPNADDIFRPTAVPDPRPTSGSGGASAAKEPQPVVELAEAKHAKAAPRTASGRVKHDEKMTVYVTSEELLELEHARLELRREHGLAVDRGRIVRAAIALALADLDAGGADSALLARLREA